MNMSNDRIYIKQYKLCKKVNTNKMKVEIKGRLVSKVKSVLGIMYGLKSCVR